MNAKKLARGAITAALYALITVAIAPISSGLMQLRLSEGLCVLPYFAPETAIGLFVGCVAANLITGAMWLDVVFGSLATLAAGLITAMIGKRGLSKWIAPLPAVIINALVIGGGAVLRIQGGRGILCLRIVCCAWRGHKLLRRGHVAMRRDKADRKEAVRLIFGPLRTVCTQLAHVLAHKAAAKDACFLPLKCADA